MMRRLTLMLCVAAALASTSCRKKSSREFYDAQGRYQVITAQLGDEAYLSPEMDAIEALLHGVPASAREIDQTTALLATISSEKARVLQEKERLAKPIATANAPAPYVQVNTVQMPAAVQAAPAADAGFHPEKGMPLDVFLKAYSACMDASPDVLLPGSTVPGQAFAVRKTANCMSQFGSIERFTKLYVFIDRKLAGEATRSEPDDSQPYKGMTSEAFLKSFGNCVTAGPAVVMAGSATPTQSYRVNADAACASKLGMSAAPGAAQKSFLFTEGKLFGESMQNIPTASPPPNVPPNVLNPGGGLPSGVNSALPPPDPSTAYTPDSKDTQRSQ